MIRYLLDTDHLTLIENRDPTVGRQLSSRPPDEFGVGVVRIEEALKGRLAASSRARVGVDRIQGYERLLGTTRFLSRVPIVPYDDEAEQLFQSFLALRIRIGTQDLRIAAIAHSRSLIVVTRNRRDFGRVPGLITEDRSVG